MTRTALYRHFDAEDRLLYVGISHRLAARGAEHAGRADWRELVVRTSAQWLESREDAEIAEREAIAAEGPIYNKTHVRGRLTFTDADCGVGLREWMDRNGIKQRQFAAHIGIGQPSLSKFLTGIALPSLETAVLIERATGGEVKPASWLRLAKAGAA